MSKAIPSIKVALGADFLTAFSNVPATQQKRVREFVEKFVNTPDLPGINYEKIQGAKDSNMHSVRITGDYRGIVLKPKVGNVYMLLWVDRHDDAYAWARNRRCHIHPSTGSIQIVLTEEAAAEIAATEPSEEPVQPVAKKAAPKSLYQTFSDEELVSLGVPSELLSHVRAISEDGDVEQLEKLLPREAFEGVFLLAAGYSISETREQLGVTKAETVDTADFGAAVERVASQRQFVVITDAAEMEQLLAAPLEQWRVFLHPSQRRLVEMNAHGPIRVLGSAGTGKTVVAMHRAAWLAKHVLQPGQKILFTTFTKNLATDISANLQKICSREDWEKIEVKHLDAWVRGFLNKQGFGIRLSYDDPKSIDLWPKALALAGEDMPFTSDFLKAEWDNVIQAHGVETLVEYLKVSRVGRSQRLNREERQRIWPVFAEYRALLNEKGLSEPADACRTASRLLEQGGFSLPYRAIIVDEAQDFGNEAFRLLRAMVPSADNDMFIAGDAHQRIYGHQVVLSRCGIDIRGRGRKLRINYRTTEELKNWASGLLQGMSFDDLDAGLDDLTGVRSLLHGEPPVVSEAASATQLAEQVGEHVKELTDSGVAPETICVVAPSHRQVEKLRRHTASAGAPTHVIEPSKADDTAQQGLRLATIHRVKGLEFDHVILAGPFNPQRQEGESAEAHARRLSLLYVAATRARKSLCVCRLIEE